MKVNKTLFLFMSLLTFSACMVSQKERFSSGRNTNGLPARVSHGMGGIEGKTYTNSLEAWAHNYNKGCRYFEADLFITSDNHLVAMHSGHESRHGLTLGFSRSDFLGIKLDGKYTPLDEERLAELFVSKPDWYLVTDVQNDQKLALEIICQRLQNHGINCKKRVIPQIYNADSDLELVKKMGFEQNILTLYRSPMSNEEVVQVIQSEPMISAVTMWADRAKAHPEFIRKLNEHHARVYVHTVNGESEIKSFNSIDVWGAYTDFNCGTPDAGFEI